MRLQALLPDSLFARLLTAMLGVLAATVLVALVLILRERSEFLSLESGARSTAQNIAETTEYLASVPPLDRASAISKLKQQPESLAPPPMRPHRREEEIAAERAFVTQVQERLGNRYRVEAGPPRAAPDEVIDLRRNMRRDERAPQFPDGPPGGPWGGPRGFDLRVHLPDGSQLTYRTAAPRRGLPMPSGVFIHLGVLTLVLATVLYVMTRTITRPLANLELAAGAIGRGVRDVQLEEKGARELRGAARAFNAMQDRVRRYLDSRTRVLAAMSHDLRTPLTRLRLRIESIDDDALRAHCSADVDEMSKMISGALGVFRGLNDEEAVAQVDIDALLVSLQKECGHMQGEVSIQGKSSRLIAGKPLALKRCLGNLLQNAIQYGKRAHVLVESGDSLIIRVRDEGAGIPEESLEQVFEPFFRLEASRNRDLGGTGLGLSIARDIAQAHGGALSLRNLSQGGLEAVLLLPWKAEL